MYQLYAVSMWVKLYCVQWYGTVTVITAVAAAAPISFLMKCIAKISSDGIICTRTANEKCTFTIDVAHTHILIL